MREKTDKLAYILSDLRRVGPTQQTLNIIRYAGLKEASQVLTLFPEGPDTMLDAYRAAGIPVACLGLSRRRFFAGGAGHLREALQSRGIALAHSCGIIPDILTYAACRGTACRQVITLRNFPMEDAPTRMHPLLGKGAAAAHLYVLKRAPNLVACSRSIQIKMQARYGLPNMVSIPNGVDISRFSAGGQDKAALRRQYKLPEKALIFLSTGSFIPRKHIADTLEAFVRAARQDALFILLGEGGLYPFLREQYGKIPAIRFFGKQADVVPFLRLSDLFLSASESEGLPNAVLEAMACGLPAFLSDITQHREILRQCPDGGLLFPLGDVAALAERIRKVDDRALARMREGTRAIYASDFTMEKMAAGYYRYYMERLGR